MKRHILDSERIFMRCPKVDDISYIKAYASSAEIAQNTFVPHPYPDDAATDFVEIAKEGWDNDTDFVFAIIEKSSQQLVGVMGIHPTEKHGRAEVGYWLGKPFWGQGYATQALRQLIQFGFEQLDLNRIQAGHFPENPASGRVMQKAGMQYEGTLKQYLYQRDRYRDVLYHAILREEYDAHNS